jgi:diguanylate cyclase (GGDEF)-like protein
MDICAIRVSTVGRLADQVDFSRMSGTWLCRDDFDRERLLDMEERIKPVRRVAMGILALALIVGAPWIGWWTLIPLVGAAGFFLAADSRLEHSERPEYLMFVAWVGSEVMIAIAVALTGGPEVATLSWLAIPVVTLSARFSMRGVIIGVAIAIALLLAVAFGSDTGAVLDNPPLVMAPLALILAIAVLSTALMQSDVEHRGEAVIDSLTGMLNRKALLNRVAELSQQSALTGQPVGMIFGDLDRFKEVNDSQGHAAGDAALTDVAYLLRKKLRAFDLAYRIGGEEFLVLLPGADTRECAKIAEDLRRAVAADTVGDGTELTISFGVSASARGGGFDYDRVFAAADEALYEAKSEGRNKVCERPPVVFSEITPSATMQAPSAATSTAS